MTSGISHFAIKVRNLAAAEQFYCGVLGLSVQRRWPRLAESAEQADSTVCDRAIWLNTGDSSATFLALEVASPVDGESQRSPSLQTPNTEHGGHHLLALRIRPEQRPSFESRLAAAGVAVSHRTAFTIYFVDPEGNRLGLSHYPDLLPDLLPDSLPDAQGST